MRRRRVLIGIIGLVTVLAMASCTDDEKPGVDAANSSDSSSLAAPSPLEGTSWTLFSYQGTEGTTFALPDPPATLSFATGGTLSGSTGCNTFVGTYTVGEAALTIHLGPMTQRSCSAAATVQELAVTLALPKVASYLIGTGSLGLSAMNTDELLRYSSVSVSAALSGSSWNVTGVNADTAVVSTPATEQLTAQFNADGTFSGFGGCNQITGPYASDDTGIVTIGPVTSATQTCPPELGQLETQYANALNTVSSYDIQGNTLTLRDANGTTQVIATKA